MKNNFRRILSGHAVFTGLLLAGFMVPLMVASEAADPVYLNTSLTPEQRAADLVQRLTLEEKASQMADVSAAIPRLKIPAYHWWNEALHGVVSTGITVFPEPVGLASTFDASAINQMATYIGVEGRIKNKQMQRAGQTGYGGGLDYWAPNLNIFRDPRWGRGQDTYGEDPFLTGRMGVAFVTGMQGNDPKYYRAISTPKHYAVHSGPESTRHFADVDVNKHDEVDTYLPAFRAAVTEGKAGSVMCVYNAVNGQPGCASEFLLQDQLRGKWGFQGYVVSDCDAVRDVSNHHHYRPAPEQGGAIAVLRGVDNECVTTPAKEIYQSYVDAVQKGYLPETALNTALTRLFTARIKLGYFDPPEMVPYNQIDEKDLDSATHRALARKLANESMVLLKNDGMLPLKPGIKKIAVIGPLADQMKVLLGNYSGTPTRSVSVLAGLKAEFPNATITYVPGTQFLRNDGDPVPDNILTTPDGKPGLKAEYSEAQSGWLSREAPKPVLAAQVEANVNLGGGGLPSKIAGKKTVGVHWTGFLTAPETADYRIGIRGDGFARLSLDGKQVTSLFRTEGIEARVGRVHLHKGQKIALDLNYGSQTNKPHAQLIWAKVNDAPLPEAIAAAKDADVVIAVVGITSALEGEEMPVNEPGFNGGDRTSIDLPEPEQALVEAAVETGKPVAVVLMNGSALAVNWINDHANAVLEAWYSGEEGGAAVAETLSGKNNPAGRLPVTFYKDVNQLPNFEDYTMSKRTYRYFKGKPLYPFGHGLSYTTFKYSDLKISGQTVNAGQPVGADVTITNAGDKAGDEVAQLYLKFPDVKGAPQIALRGFQRIHLAPGERQTIHFDLKDRDLGMVTMNGDPIIAAGDYTLSIGGGQPDTGAAGLSGRFHVEGQLALPE